MKEVKDDNILKYSIKYNNTELTEKFLNIDNIDILSIGFIQAVKNNDKKLIKRMASLGDIYTIDEAIMLLIEEGNIKLIEKILKYTGAEMTVEVATELCIKLIEINKPITEYINE